MIGAFFTTSVLWMGTAIFPLTASLICYCLGAISIGILNILVFSSIPKQVEPIFIGRVITLLTSVASCGMPLGSLIGGVLGGTFSTTIPVLICGIAMILFSLYWLSSTVLRTLPTIDNVKLFSGRVV